MYLLLSSAFNCLCYLALYSTWLIALVRVCCHVWWTNHDQLSWSRINVVLSICLCFFLFFSWLFLCHQPVLDCRLKRACLAKSGTLMRWTLEHMQSVFNVPFQIRQTWKIMSLCVTPWMWSESTDWGNKLNWLLHSPDAEENKLIWWLADMIRIFLRFFKWFDN